MVSTDMAVVACTGIGLYAAWRVFTKVLSAPYPVDPRELACRTCSAIHAAPVSAVAVLAVVGVAPPWVGALCMSVSIGYFIQDAIVVLSMGTEPNFAPILAHHVLCGAAMATMLTISRPNIWYGNFLQCTEVTIPFQFASWLLEIYGANKSWPRTYAVVRWLMAILWVSFRIVLMGGFIYVVWRDWSALDTISRLNGVLLGPFLTAFNIGGLVKVVLPGLPSWPPTASTGTGTGSSTGTSKGKQP